MKGFGLKKSPRSTLLQTCTLLASSLTQRHINTFAVDERLMIECNRGFWNEALQSMQYPDNNEYAQERKQTKRQKMKETESATSSQKLRVGQQCG